MIREARLKMTLFQSIVIYNLVIAIENNGIIILLCLTPLFKETMPVIVVINRDLY